MEFNQQIIIRALRLSFTCILLFFFTWYYQVPESAWALITIWFVMFEYHTVGGVITKCLYRATGTILSALYGILLIYFCHNNAVINILALTPAVLLYCYYFMDSEKAYIAIIGSVTLTIVLLNYNRVDLAILRVFNIVLGIVFSMLMIRFFYPQYARDSLLKTQSSLILLLLKIMRSYLDESLPLEKIKKETFKIEQDIVALYPTINRLLHEAKIETIKSPIYITYNQSLFEHIRHIFRLTSFITNYIATEEIRSNKAMQRNYEFLLAKLEAAQIKLDSGLEKPSPPILSVKETMEMSTLSSKNKFIKTVFEELYKEITLLDADINEIVSIYRQYKVGYFLRLTHRLR